MGVADCVREKENKLMGCLLDDLRPFGINVEQWKTAAQDDEREGEWRKTTKQGAERSMAKWIAAEKARARLRHAVVCPNVTGRTKERIAQSKRARGSSLATVGQPQVARTYLYPPCFFVCRSHIPVL